VYAIEAFKTLRNGSNATVIRIFRAEVKTRAEAMKLARKHKGAVITWDVKSPGIGRDHLLVQKMHGTWRGVTKACGIHGVPFEGFRISKY